MSSSQGFTCSLEADRVTIPCMSSGVLLSGIFWSETSQSLTSEAVPVYFVSSLEES